MSNLKLETFLFDINGYLVIEDVLSKKETLELSQLLNDHKLPEMDHNTGLGKIPGGGAGTEGAGFLEFGTQFCDLLDHPKIMSALRIVLGEGFRIDHFWGAAAESGADSLRLHGGVVPFDQTNHFFSRGDKLYSGLTNVAWNLTDSGGDHGGFMVLPGSHKANFPLPKEMSDREENAYGVSVPKAKAGSVTIFSEAVLHGASGWKASHQRQTLFFSYTPSHIAYSRKPAIPPTTVQLTKRQHLLFEPPSAPHSFNRPTLFEAEYAP